MKEKAIRNLIYKLITVFFSIFITLLFVNYFFIFFSTKQKIPRSLAGTLTNHLFTYYPDTYDKSNLKEYTAILGDSNAMGSGDAYLNNSYNYSIGHFLHKKKNKNYLNFARGGYGSISAVANYMKLIELGDHVLFYEKLNFPSEILFFFYEGNDLDENLKEYEINKYKDLNLKEYVSRKIRERSQVKNNDIFNANFPVLKLMGSIKFQLKRLLKDISNNTNLENIYNSILLRIKKATGKNVILANKERLGNNKKPFWKNSTKDGRLSEIRPIEAAAVDMNKQQIDLSLNIFFESIIFLGNLDKKINIKIIYLPSPGTSYNWVDPIRYYPRYYKEQLEDKKLKFKKVSLNKNLENNIYIRNMISLFAQQNEFDFIDLTERIQKKTNSTILHGPIDWVHYNMKGYEYIAENL